MGLILLIVLVVLLMGGLPRWGYSRNWGYGPSGGLGLLLVILLVPHGRRVHPPRLLNRLAHVATSPLTHVPSHRPVPPMLLSTWEVCRSRIDQPGFVHRSCG